ncbi:hypothetical protein OIDMADRAFT_21149 [Oidiodendron maius Zn]|uniref:Uncharacterized protein n=1 Tax=Oidiodendron maius (strain Zn) TaxID=913774 RepID=A0A0C3C977_OIDMZ|nr:hypothetical protein OIDMADRAFT_21149 [Oidiodendron maius Zn]
MSSICSTFFYQKWKEDFWVAEPESIVRVENGASFCVGLLAVKEESCGNYSAVENTFLCPDKEIMGIGRT